MSWFTGCNPSAVVEACATDLEADEVENPAVFNPLSWPAHDMDDGLDLPTFDLYVKCMVQYGAAYPGNLEVPEQMVSVGEGSSFNVLRRSRVAIRKHADQVAFQGASRVSYAKLKPFIQELLVLHHPYLQKKKVLVGLVGFAWDIKPGVSDMLTVVTPALDLEFAEHGTLAQYLKAKPLQESLSKRRTLSQQILAGLSCLHKCFIVHGDLKPENILVYPSESGSGIVAKLSDFGHSMFVSEGDFSLKKLFGGTRPWNSPEWLESRPSKDFYKSDIYSVGLLIWACFSMDEDPFNLEGRNRFAKLDFLPETTIDQKLLQIEAFKTDGEVHEVADQTTTSTLTSLDSGFQRVANSIVYWRDRDKRDLLKSLRVVFEKSLRLNPDSRSLQACINALEARTSSKSNDETQDKNMPSTWWAPIYLNPRRVSPKVCQLGILRGPSYSLIQGSSQVARLSVAINKRICLDTDAFTVDRRRDAAWFLFRSYFENYGVEEDVQNKALAAEWLYEFARLGITSGSENLCFSIPEFCGRLNCDLPSDFPLDASVRSGLKSSFNHDCYVLSLCRKRAQAFPGLFQAVFFEFKSEGLRRLIPGNCSLADIANFESTTGRESSVLSATTRLHIAAACGDIKLASILIKKYKIDPNVREALDHLSPLYTALKFSQAGFVLWLLSQGVIAGIKDQGIPVLCFISNFEPPELAKILRALCQAGASMNDTWWFDALSMHLDMLSLATWAAELSTIELMLAETPSISTCGNALQRACSFGRLDVVKTIEFHMSHTLKAQLKSSDWKVCLSLLTILSPFQKLYLPFKPDYSKTIRYIIERLGSELDPRTIYNWLKMALTVGDCESLSLWLEQDGSRQFLRRSRLSGENEKSLQKSALEWAIVLDRKAMFDLLLSQEPLLELEQSDGNFPTLLHIIAQRDLLHGKSFCQARLALDDEVDVKAANSLSEVTAFEIAVRYKNYQIADILLQKGARIDGFETSRVTPLGELINSHSREAIKGIKFLLEHPRGKPSFVVDRDQKRTALHLAAGPDYYQDWQYLKGIEDHEAIMDIILEHYGEERFLNSRDMAGFTALHHAAYRGCDWAVEKLLKAGANPNLYSCTGLRPLDCAQAGWGLSKSVALASPNFNISSTTSQTRRAATRSRCSYLLTAASGGSLADIILDIGFKKVLLGSFGLINIAKEDKDDYEPWVGEFPLKFITRRLSKLRNGPQARIEA